MHQRIPKAAKPKQAQLRRSAEAQETMGDPQGKKHLRERSRSPQRPPVDPETFWSSLVRNWNSYSRKKKFGLIIIGLVGCGLTVYLATQLASSMFVQLSTQFDKESPLQKHYPEFHKGTKAYSKQDAAAMEKGYQKTQAALRTVLEKSRHEKVVIGVGEAHDSSFFQKINIWNVVKQHQAENPDIPVTVIKEIPHGNVKTAKETQQFLTEAFVDKLNHPAYAALEPSVYKKSVDTIFESLPKVFPERLPHLTAMSVIATHMYGFKHVVSEGHPPLTSAQQQTMAKHPNPFGRANIILSRSSDHKKVEVVSDHPLSHYVLQQTDRSLVVTTRNALKQFKKNGIVITVLGSAHLLAYAEALKKMGVPHELLHLQSPHTFLDDFMALREYCFLPIERCPIPLQQEAVKRISLSKLIPYCGIPNSDPDAKNCDTYLAEKVAYFGNGSAFNLNMTNQIPETLSKRSPKAITDFFTTEDAISRAKTPIPTPTQLSRLYPELLEGTTQHSGILEQEMEKAMAAIHKILFPFLKAHSGENAVVVLGEDHTESFFQKCLLNIYLKLWQQYHPSFTVRFVYEAEPNTAQYAKRDIENIRRQFKFMGELSDQEESKNMTTAAFQSNCFDRVANKSDTRTAVLVRCSLYLLGLYQFEVVASENHPPLTQQEKDVIAAHHDPRTKVRTALMSFKADHSEVGLSEDNRISPFELKQIDQGLLNTLQPLLQTSTHPTLFVVVTGQSHLIAFNALQQRKVPHLLVNLQSTPMEQLVENRETLCFMAVKDCPAVFQQAAKDIGKSHKVNIQFFGFTQTPYDSKRCDVFLHENYADQARRDKFSEGLPHQVPQVQPLRNPTAVTDFFAPPKTIQRVKQAFEEDKKYGKRVEL